MSLTRRTLRTTAAAAGMAALGVGLAGPALADPVTPEPDLLSGSGPVVPVLPAANPLATLPIAQDGPALPMLFKFEGPTVHSPTINTTGPTGGLTKLRRSTAAPVRTGPAPSATPRSTPPAHVGGGQVGGAQVAPVSPGADRVGALSELDSVGMFDDLVGPSVVDQRGVGTSSLGWLG